MDNEEWDGWVTDPRAIATAVALRAIKVGDEIRIKDADDYNIHPRFNGTVVVHDDRAGVIGTPSQRDCKYAQRPIAFGFADNWVGCAENIAAWRPKRG